MSGQKMPNSAGRKYVKSGLVTVRTPTKRMKPPNIHKKIRTFQFPIHLRSRHYLATHPVFPAPDSLT